MNIPIIDSSMTFEEAVLGTKAPKGVIDSLCLITVCYRAFDGRLYQGQLVVHGGVEKEVIEIFEIIERLKFPIARVVPIVKYDWSDDASMVANNTSAFNYRFIMGTDRFSHHAYGRAVDINPFLNPVIYEDGRIDPPGAIYNTEEEGTFSESHPIVQEFLRRGWRWGGNFRPSIDYHHFDKPD
jgi:peptidoglycan L-alanyl-D-glutamate endopeptidase CwlK